MIRGEPLRLNEDGSCDAEGSPYFSDLRDTQGGGVRPLFSNPWRFRGDSAKLQR